MAKLSSQFASISPGMGVDEAQEGLVSIMRAYDVDPNDVKEQIMDKVNVLGKILPKHTAMYGVIKHNMVDNYIGQTMGTLQTEVRL